MMAMVAVGSVIRHMLTVVGGLGIVLVFHKGSFTEETGAPRGSYKSGSEFVQSQSKQAVSAQSPQNVSSRARRFLRAR